jgi:RNA polymerase sigma factor (sigma-70 family)
MSYINLLDENLLLWNRFREGDADAFAALMNIHYRDLFHYGERIVRDHELVKDCIQDLFLSLWEHRSTINETSFVKYYLLKSLRRKLIRAIEKKRYLNISDDSYFEGIFDRELPAGCEYAEQENLADLSQKIRKVLAALPGRQQEVIYFRFYMDADIEEIAEIMEMNTQSVYNLLHRSLKKLKKITAQKPFSLTYFMNILPSVI